MDPDRFRACTEAYGAERRRWPSPQRPLYDALAPTPEGVRILGEAELTDRLLDAWDSAAPHDLLAQRVVAQSGIQAAPALRWLRIGGFALSVAAGFAIGFAQMGDDGAFEMAGQLIAGPAEAQDIGP